MTAFRADPLTTLRIAWLTKAAHEAFGVRPNQSAIIRRALHHYQGRLEDVVSQADDSALALESMALRDAFRLQPAPIGPERVTQAPAGALLSALIAQAAQEGPGPQERIWADLDGWVSRMDRRLRQ